MSPFITPEPFVSVRAFVENDGEYLISQRMPGCEQEGLWEFPGGKKDPNETPLEAVLREAYEETGLNITPVTNELIKFDDRIIPDGKHAGKQIMEYGLFAVAATRKLRLTEHTAASWVRIEGLYQRRDLARCMPAAIRLIRNTLQIA